MDKIDLPATNAAGTLRYVWNGKKLTVEDIYIDNVVGKGLDGRGAACLGKAVRKRDALDDIREKHESLVHCAKRHVHHRVEAVRAAFFPKPELVTPDYWEYVRWRGWHRLFSSMSSIFSTQSLLLAVGVGAKKTLPAAAGINWVLKDGLGRLGRLTMATRFGESFDSDLKRFRFTSSMLYGGALALDYLTPLVPAYFLPMAAVANIGKSIGLTTYIATQPAFFKSFAKSENIADISAKAQAQQMAIDTLGLALAVSLNLAVRRNERVRRMLPLALFPILIPGDLFSIYHELRSVHLRTLNKERAEFIAASWLKTGTIPSPEQVSKEERFILPPVTALGAFPLDIRPLEDSIKSTEDLEAFLKQSQRSKKYFISVDTHGRGRVSATLSKGSATRDILELILTVAHMRHHSSDSNGPDLWMSERHGRQNVASFMKKLKHAGWQVEPFILSRTERIFYSQQ